MSSLTFYVEGTPQTQGSMRAFVVGKRAVLTSTNKKLKAWRECVALNGRLAAGDQQLIDGPVRLALVFDVDRPRSHFKPSGILKTDAPQLPHQHVGDLDKLIRAIGDALTGVIWTDDRRIVQITASKRYDISRQGVHITVEAL